MKKSLVILSTALAVFASTSCNGNNPPVRPNPPAPPVTPSVKVTEVEWNEAIENIVNHKKQNYLNYVAKGDLAITEVDGSYEETEHIYLIEMNGDCGHANELISSDTIYDTFSLKKGHTYLEVYKHDDVVGGDINEEPLYGFFDEVLDLYGNMSAFTYEKDRYIVKPE